MAKIKQEGKVSFGQAVGDFFRGYVDFKGQTTRAGYWWMMLAYVIAVIVMFTLSIVVGAASNSIGGSIFVGILIVIFWIGMIIPTVAMTVRRYRDAGVTGWGTLVLYFLGIACSYTQFYSLMTSFSVGYDYYTDVPSFSGGGSPIFFFLNMVIGFSFFLLTVFPTDMLVTESENKFLLFFLRRKNA